MTRITIDKDLLSVSARGHAGFDRTGRDIVCAAASMLMFALCAFAEENGGAGFTEGDLFRVEFPAEENDYLFGRLRRHLRRAASSGRPLPRPCFGRRIRRKPL